MDFADWMATVQARTEAALGGFLPPAARVPARLHEAMRYAALAGGKRVRPMLCHAAGDALGADPVALDAAACAVEFIHVYSLVHDDLPCMDDDALRRGKPTCHIAFDEATALLVGDALQALAFDVLARPIVGVDPARQLQMLRLLGEAAGSCGMAGGQAIDLAAVGKAIDVTELEYMHIHKTGALIRASVLLGALVADSNGASLAALSTFANRAGLLFQVVDDILDAEADSATLGKTAGKDQAANKPTYYRLLGPRGAKDFAAALRSDALAALDELPHDCTRLRQLTHYIADRRF